MTAPSKGSVSPVVLLAGVLGAVLAYSGLKNKSISNSFRALLAGQSPADAASNPSVLPSTQTDSTGFILSGSSSSGGVSQQAFFSDVLRGVGAPVTQGGLNALAGVTNTEGVNNYFNPFNIEWHPGDNTAWQGVGNANDAGVQRYGSYQQGVNATVAFLTQNSRWSQVVSSLKTGNQTLSEAALTAAYTWAAFKRAGSNAGSLLSAPAGG